MLRSFLSVRKMASTATGKVPDVDIDPNGVFKYILIKLGIKDADGKRIQKNIVRGYAECHYHSDIADKVEEQLQKLKKEKALQDWNSKVLGGGRISHDPDCKAIKVYGYSQGYGKADHEETVRILKTTFEDYDITWSDEGY